MKKVVCFLLSIAVAISFVPTGVAVNAASTIVSVYDSEGLEIALTTADADIVLWNDIKVDYPGEIICNSIDLNGYNLSLYSTNLSSSGKKFTVLDQVYNSADCSSTGSLKISYLHINEDTFVVESGIVTIGIIRGNGSVEVHDGIVTVDAPDGSSGYNGSNGEKGDDGYDNTAGSNGEAGEDGGNGQTGIKVSNLYLYGGTLSVIAGNAGDGGDGGDGGAGGDGENGTNHDGKSGGKGGNGGDAGTSGVGIIATNEIIVYNGTLTAVGGNGANGGNGGNGGDGGHGAKAVSSNSNYQGGGGGDGGSAGNGGSNSHGGEGILAKSVIIYAGEVTAIGGSGGKVGSGGKGGTGGKGSNGWSGNYNAPDGKTGASGYGGFSDDDGGAGINAEFTMYDGVVTSTGGVGGAGIGGSGYSGELDGHNVNISGGNIVVTAGNGAFDIGGGYKGYTTGESGTLTVTGGTLEFSTYGRATNVSTPTFENCTITGEGAYQHEGTYNSDGKFTVTIDSIEISPTSYLGNDDVTLQANISISRVNNITTPSPKGKVLFKLDGEEIESAVIENSISNNGKIGANATINWTAVEGEHIITAEYIAGTNDSYASSGVYELSCNVAGHIHEWEDEYTVDVSPSCLTSGSKSIHCSICDSQKDVIEIPANGHSFDDDYDSTCNECGEVREVADPNAPAVVVSNVTAKAGDTFTVDVSIKNNSGIIGLRAYLEYDADVLELVSIVAGEKFADTSFGPLTQNPMSILWDGSLNGNSTTNGVVATLTFKVKEGAEPGETALTVTYDPDDIYDSNWDNVEFAVENGTVTIIEYISGDVNGDGKVNNKDFGILRQFLNNWGVEIDELAADVNRDGKVNNKDMGILRQYLNNWGVELK